MKYHDIWCAECLLNLCLSSSHSTSVVLASACRTIAESLLGRMLVETIAPRCQSNSTFWQSSQGKSQRSAISSTTGSLCVSSLSLPTKMSFLTALKESSDELSSYISMPLSIDDVALLQKGDVVIEFWVSKKKHFLNYVATLSNYRSHQHHHALVIEILARLRSL